MSSLDKYGPIVHIKKTSNLYYLFKLKAPALSPSFNTKILNKMEYCHMNVPPSQMRKCLIYKSQATLTASAAYAALAPLPLL